MAPLFSFNICYRSSLYEVLANELLLFYRQCDTIIGKIIDGRRVAPLSKEKKRFLLFDTQREGKEILKSDVIKEPNLKKFWILLKENFMNRLLYANLTLIIGNFPLIFLLLALIGVGQAEYFEPQGNLFMLLRGLFEAGADTTPGDLAMIGIQGAQQLARANTVLTYVFYGLSALALFTWGFVHVGITYILRNLAMGRPIFFMSDFFETIRKNWKQALGYGIIDLVIIAILPSNMYTLLQTSEGNIAGFFFWTTVVLFLAYLMMRWYVYLQIVTFDMSLFRIISNSMKFILLGFKRNILALLGSILLTGLAILFALAFNGVLVVLALAIPMFCLFSLSSFMGIYAAWFKIDEIMVIHTESDKEICEE